MNKYLIFLVAILFVADIANSQAVNDTIHFDYYNSASDNDFVNNFLNNNLFTQITTGGITGGGVEVPDTLSVLQNMPVYCRSLANHLDSLSETGFDFFYDRATIDYSVNRHAVDLFIYGDLNNSYLLAYIDTGRRLNLTGSTGGGGSSSITNPVFSGHWFRFTLSYIPHNVNGYAKVSFYDLGITGMSTPTIVGQMIHTSFNNADLHNSTFFGARICGEQAAGCQLIDNFTAHGNYYSDACGMNSINRISVRVNFNVYPQPAFNHFNIDVPAGFDEIQKISCKITDVTGRDVSEKFKKNSSAQSTLGFSFENVSPGIYFVNLFCDEQFICSKRVMVGGKME